MSADLLARIAAHAATLSDVTAAAPEWGLEVVHFRRATARQADKFSRDVQKDAVRAAVDLVLATACDETGALLFEDCAATRSVFATVDQGMMMRLLRAASGSGSGPDAIEAEKKG